MNDDTLDLLLLADEDEDAGDWETAAWRRLQAAYGNSRVAIYVKGSVTTEDGRLTVLVSTLVNEPYFLVSQDDRQSDPIRLRWSWWRHRGWEQWNESGGGGYNSNVCPPWLRWMIELAARQAVAKVLKT